MAHPAPFRQYPGQTAAAPPPPQDPYGPPRNTQSRQGGYPRDEYNDPYRDDRNYRNGPPPQQQQPYPPPPPGSSRGGPPPQMRRPPPNGLARDDYHDRRAPPHQMSNGYDDRRAMYQPPPAPQQQQPGGPRRPRPPMQALDLAGQQMQRPSRRPGVDDYGALVSPVHDKRFDDDRRQPYPPQQRPSPTNRGPPSRMGPPGEPMPTMQFSMNAPPPRTKSAPPDDPRNWGRDGQPPMPRQQRDPYDDRRPPGPPQQNMANGRGPPRGRPPMDRPPQQMYDRGPEPRRRSPQDQYPPYERGPPSRSNTYPVLNDNFDPRGPPPSQRGYDPPPQSRDRYDARQEDPRYHPDRRPNQPQNGNVDELLDDYLEELGSPIERPVLPGQFDGNRRPDPRDDYPPPSRGGGGGGGPGRRTPPPQRSPEDRYSPPDRRQLTQQLTQGPPPPGPGRLPRSQTAQGISDLNRPIASIDLRNDTTIEAAPRTRSPNKLHKSPPRVNTAQGVQSQAITSPNGTVHDPNALPIFPSRNSLSSTQSRPESSGGRGSYGSDKRISKPQVQPKPPLTFALLEDYRREAKDNPTDPGIQLQYGKALVEAATVLAPEQGMGDPKRVTKARQDYIAEGYKIVKKLAASVGSPLSLD